MSNIDKRQFLRKPWVVFLVTFLVLTLLLTILTVSSGTALPYPIGTYYLFGGLTVAVISFAFINKANVGRGNGYGSSQYLTNIEYFKKVRAEEKPFEKIIWSIISASLSVAILGYFLNKLLEG